MIPRAVQLDMPLQGGNQCWYVSVANVLAYQRWAYMTEVVAFGLASRLTLQATFEDAADSSFDEKIIPRFRNIYATPEPLSEINRGRLGIRLGETKDADAQTTWEVTKGELAAGRPQMVEVNYADLPHVAEQLRSNWGHVVVVTGYSELDGEVYLADGATRTVMPIPTFVASRDALVATPTGDQFLANRWYKFNYEGRRPLDDKDVLQDAAYHVFSRPDHRLSRALLIRDRMFKIADWLETGLDQLNEVELRLAGLKLYQRLVHTMAPYHTFKMYADFLNYASKQLADPLLGIAAQAFEDLSMEWLVTSSLSYKMSLLGTHSISARVPARVRRAASLISERILPLTYDQELGKLTMGDPPDRE